MYSLSQSGEKAGFVISLLIAEFRCVTRCDNQLIREEGAPPNGATALSAELFDLTFGNVRQAKPGRRGSLQ